MLLRPCFEFPGSYAWQQKGLPILQKGEGTGGRFSAIFWQAFNILFWHGAELMSGLLAFRYSTPQKNFHRGCNLSCYPRGQARLSTGLATAVNRALLSVKLKATMHKRCSEESIGGGPRHEHEVVWIRPASSSFRMQNMKTWLRPWFCVPIQ